MTGFDSGFMNYIGFKGLNGFIKAIAFLGFNIEVLYTWKLICV